MRPKETPEEEIQRQAGAAARYQVAMEQILVKLRVDELITGDELIDVSKYLGIPARGGTVGMLRNRVHFIDSGMAKVNPNSMDETYIPYKAYKLYRQCAALAKQRIEPPETQSPERSNDETE